LWHGMLGDLRGYKERMKKDGLELKGLRIQTFSDTIVISLLASDPARLVPLIGELAGLSVVAGFVRGLYLRGCISVGMIHRSGSMLLGPAVDEAAAWYTQGEMFGLYTAPSATFALERLIQQGKDISHWFVRWDIPLKRGGVLKSFVHNFPGRGPRESLVDGISFDGRAHFLDCLSRNPVSPEAYPKMANTLAFHDKVWSSNKKDAETTAHGQ